LRNAGAPGIVEQAMSDEYDAFGRKKDEAGLGDLGWGSSGDAGAPSTPAPEASPNATRTATPPPTQFQTLPPPTGLGKPRRNPLIFVVQVAVIFGIGLAIFFAVDSGNHTGNAVRKSIDDFTRGGSGSGGGGGGNKEDAKVPEQVKARDYFTTAGLRAGLKLLQKEQPGKVSNFSFRRDRIDVQVVRGGKTHIIDFPNDAEVPQEFSASDATSLTDSISYEEINPTAVERLMHAANARLNRSKADVDYFVVSKFSGSITWGIYYKGGKPIAQGDSRGRYTRQIS
jgi:hypothetical protein